MTNEGREGIHTGRRSASGNQSDRTDARRRDDRLSLDATFTLLADRHRRRVLDYLLAGSGKASIEDLATHVVELRDDDATRPTRDRVLTVLHHVHLPKLADAGVLDYDTDTGELEYRPHDRLERWLRRVDVETR